MSEAAVLDAPTINVDELVRELREWVTKECSLGDSVRDDAYRCALSATVHRVVKWGWEPSLNLLTARDALNCVLMAGGEGAEMYMRIAFTRGLIEDDRAVVQKLLDLPFVPESRLFVSKIMHGLTDGDAALAEAAAWIDTLRGEELSVACLVIGRHVPDVIAPEWLEACPENNPRLCAEMALLLMRQERFDALAKAYVRARPKVRYAVDSDRWGRL